MKLKLIVNYIDSSRQMPNDIDGPNENDDEIVIIAIIAYALKLNPNQIV